MATPKIFASTVSLGSGPNYASVGKLAVGFGATCAISARVADIVPMTTADHGDRNCTAAPAYATSTDTEPECIRASPGRFD